MAQGTEFMRLNLLFVSAMLADGTEPELIVHKRTTGDDTSGKLCIARWANLTIVGYQRLAARALRFAHSTVLRAISAEKYIILNN